MALVEGKEVEVGLALTADEFKLEEEVVDEDGVGVCDWAGAELWELPE